MILSHLTPFSLPFFAAVYMIRKEKAPLALIGLLAGAITLSIGNIVYTFAACTLFLVSFRLSKKMRNNHVKALPFFVLFTTFLVKCAFLYIQQHQTFTVYDGVMAGVEAALAFILTLIFMQSIPLLSMHKRKKSLKTEEIVSLIIMLASVMTGTIGWTLL